METESGKGPYIYKMTTDVQDAAYHLKHHTAQPHSALEETVLPRLQALAETGDYIDLLKSFYGYFKPVELLIGPYIDETVLPDMAQRRKADFILHDLTFSKAHISNLPLATRLPQIHNVHTALGALYVLEGSTLGGRGITKLLLKNKALKLQPEQVRFFNGYGAATGTMWVAFLKTLNEQGETAAARTQMATAAAETFTLFKNWLDKL